MESLLKKIYYDPKTGLVSAEKLYQKAKLQDSQITRKHIKEFLSSQEVAQIYKERKVKHDYPLQAHNAFFRIQIDLLDVSNENPQVNQGNKFIFTCIDVFSRYAFALPQKNKTESECLKNFKSIQDEIHKLGFKTYQVDSDNESSFHSKSFTSYCNQNGITQKFNTVGNHKALGVIDSFSRTLRRYISRYQTAFSTQKWTLALPDLIHNYNNTINKGVNKSPIEAIYLGGLDDHIDDKTSKAETTNYNKETFEIGDSARLAIKRALFEKAGRNFTKTIHTIEKIEQGLYFVTDRTTGYRKSELQKISRRDSVTTELRKQETLQKVDPSSLNIVVNESPSELDHDQQIESQKIERRITRRMGREGVEKNIHEHTDEEKTERAIRGRKQRDFGPYYSYY